MTEKQTSRTNFVKVTEFGLAVMSLWHCFTFRREQHINFAYVWAIYEVIYRRIMVMGKYHARGFVRHRDVWNKLCPLDHQTTGCNLRCFRPHSAVLIVLPRISSSKSGFHGAWVYSRVSVAAVACKSFCLIASKMIWVDPPYQCVYTQLSIAWCMTLYCGILQQLFWYQKRNSRNVQTHFLSSYDIFTIIKAVRLSDNLEHNKRLTQ